MADYRKNLANAVVDTMTPSTTATTIPLVAGYGATMPAVPYFMTFTPPGQLSTLGNSEIVLVSARTTDSLTVVRGQKGTTAKSIRTGWLGSASIIREMTAAVGDIVMTFNTTPQNGRVFMDGGTYNKSDYPLLYDHVVNNAGYGTTTSTTFTLRDMRGRVPVGKAASGTFNTLAGTGGSETHTLTLAQLPNVTGQIVAHSSYSAFWIPSGVFSGSAMAGQCAAPGAANGGANSINNLNFSLGGGGQSHPILQPYIVTNYEVVAG